ncbi:MAG: hypothetical protein ACRETQ_05400 [Gammaproteobacteria bacterium]
MAAASWDIAEYWLYYVDVRFYREAALVRASGSWTNKAAIADVSRYIDVYVHNEGE